MTTQELLTYVGTALGGGASFKLLEYLTAVKKENRSDFDTINQRLNDEIKRLYARIDELEKENKELENRVRLLEGSSSEDLPFPMWHKDMNGHYIWINQKFINSFLIPLGKSPEDIINKRDEDVWNSDTSRLLTEIDGMALIAPDKEASKTNVILDNRITRSYTIYKYPLYVRRILVGFGGIAFQENAHSSK